MLRPICYSVFVFVLMTQTVFAQTSIGVRTGEHAEYSRVVFDWDENVEYTADKSESGALTLDFKQAASLNTLPSKTNTARNISGFSVLSEDPLRVRLTFPEKARIRDFRAGSRIVVDVYKVEGAPTPPAVPVPEVENVAEISEPEPSAENSAIDGVEEQEEDSAIETEEVVVQPLDSEDVSAPDQSELADVPPEELPEEISEELQEPAPLQVMKEKAQPSVVSLSSTRSQGLAAFELNNELWIVNDQPDLLLSPQVTGPDEGELAPLQSVEIDGGKAYKTKPMQKEYNIRGQGGGLVWRVILSQDEVETNPVEPLRENIVEGEVRSGRVVWPFDEMSSVLEIEDPVTGFPVTIVTVKNSKLYGGDARDFVDFETLSSPAGLAIRPKVDDLIIRKLDRGIEVTRPGGLALQSEKNIANAVASKSQMSKLSEEAEALSTQPKVFDFKNWQIGGLDTLAENGSILLDQMNAQSKEAQVESLVTLGKMYLSNAMGQEALGFLRYAELLLPDLDSNPEFVALRGAAKALSWKSESAFEDLSRESLEPFEEIGLWKSYALADLGDWEQAAEFIPKNHDILYTYPALIFNRLSLVIAEIELRSGRYEDAMELLEQVEENQGTLFDEQKAALAYLEGEAARQDKDIEKTIELWEPLVTGKDDLYRAKAGLALTRLLVNEKRLSPDDAIDRLERLRYAWRGDQLEAQIYYWLGRTYFEAEDYVKGLNLLREAAGVAAGTQLGTRIASEMSDIFADVYLSDKLQRLSPMDAAALYEQFTELVPIGSEGNKVVEMLAERMVQADLMDRAASLLSHQLNHRLSGAEAHRVGVRLAAIYLLDKRPDEAMKALNKATGALQTLPEELQTQNKFTEISLLRAKALSQQKRPDQALALLNDLGKSADINRLRADIAWAAGYWDDAGEALDDVIIDENISLTRPLSEEHAAIILNRAVALNLGGDRIALANMREKYTDAMTQTDKARVFEVISRPRQSAALADRETLMGIVSEVDLFADFMKSYVSSNPASN